MLPLIPLLVLNSIPQNNPEEQLRKQDANLDSVALISAAVVFTMVVVIVGCVICRRLCPRYASEDEERDEERRPLLTGREEAHISIERVEDEYIQQQNSPHSHSVLAEELPTHGEEIIEETSQQEAQAADVVESRPAQKLRSKYSNITNRLIRTGDIVAQLFQNEQLTTKERDDIQHLLSTPIRASEQLLNTLLMKDDCAYDCFITALIYTDQEHIAEILTSEETCLDTETFFMIQRNYVTLLDTLDVDSGLLLDRLYACGALNRGEIGDINSKPTKREKSKTLLDLAGKFSDANFKKFLQALEESSQKHVISIMTGQQYEEIVCEVTTSTTDDSDVQYKEYQKNSESYVDSSHALLHKPQENSRTVVKETEKACLYVKRTQIRKLQSKFADLQDGLQTQISLKVAVLQQRTVLLSGTNVEICFRKLLQDFIEHKKEGNRNQTEIELIREIARKANESAQHFTHQSEDTFKREIEILQSNISHHLDEALKATLMKLDDEKERSRGLEWQLRLNQTESVNLLKQIDLLQGQLDERKGCNTSLHVSPYEFRQQMEEFVKEKLTDILKDEAYSQVQRIIERPCINESEIDQFWLVVFPYIIQRIKLWNGYVLTAQNLANLVVGKEKPSSCTNDFPISSFNSNTPRKTKMGDRPVFPISKLDFMTYLVNIADCIVAHDILQIISKFPMAIPLILQDIHEKNKFIVTVPIIQNTVIKWESNPPGQIVENHLFRSKFQMVTAIRLGTNKIIGKSTILNQMMNKPFMFSSKGEPGGRYGRPSTLDGAVEIVWLTQATCSEPTWKTTLSQYYKRNTDNIVILANLHGNALDHPHIVKYLKKHSCSFIVFIMPDSSEQELTHLGQCIKIERIVKVLVDPNEDEDDEDFTNAIRTDSLSCDDTLDTIRCLLHKSLNFKIKAGITNIGENYHPYESLRYADSLYCMKSEEILTIVREHGCLKIKQLLISSDLRELANLNCTIRFLIKSFLDLLSLPTKDAKKHLTHLETNLYEISTSYSVAAHAEVSESSEWLRRILKVPSKTANGGNSEDRQMEEALRENELEAAMSKFNDINLGQEHFFRVLGQMYENSEVVDDLGEFKSVRHLPNQFADLLIDGHAIEMLNGDSGQIQMIWLKAICDSVVQKLPNLKVFVISIIGLKSSGKSTLLNALFSCRFDVSVGRCSRGFYMRMVFLEETLRRSHGYDAIILIDTEGLSSPEKMNDPKASQRDRLMATFAIGISNLTIVNILGERMTEMTGILQIAIVAMARLREGNIKPDILMVQQLQERNLFKMDKIKSQLCEAINNAFDLICKNDVEIGSTSADSLSELITRTQSGDLFQYFGPLKDGSSVSSPPSEGFHDDVVVLLETILKRSEISQNKISFARWCDWLKSYWTCVQEENFALKFQNVWHITEFLYFEKKIANVKELIDRAIRHHREIFGEIIKGEVSCQIIKKGKEQDSVDNRTKLLERIKQELELIPQFCPINCEFCKRSNEIYAALLEELKNSEWLEDTKQSLQTQCKKLHNITMIILKQTFDGLLVRQGCFPEFSVEIASQLKGALSERPDGMYNDDEQKTIIKNIWDRLQVIAASQDDGTDLEIKLAQTLQREYGGKFPTILEDLKNDITLNQLLDCKAIDSLWDMFRQLNWKVTKQLDKKLKEDELQYLINGIKDLSDTVFRSRCWEFGKTGLNFEEGMVIEIKTAFPEEIKRFENKFGLKLRDTLKMKLQIYALQYFCQRMAGLQKLWNSQNKPYEILMQKEHDYITDIQTILASGFSSAGEGAVVATKLCQMAKERARLAGFYQRIELVKNVSWILNSVAVRVRYFGELAEEVAKGKKERAVKHFQNPKDAIEEWFIYEVNEEVMKVYTNTIQTELESLARKISNCITTAEINEIVEIRLENGDDNYISKVEIKDHDFRAFRNSIEHKLLSFSKSIVMNEIFDPLASQCSEIMDKLGCTEHCPWCGALCWGSRGHHLEKDISGIEAHHSSHQPLGLIGTYDRGTTKLISTACHNQTDQRLTSFENYVSDKMLGSSEKWKFGAHYMTEFDEMMRWFFHELHHDIAKSRGLLPADDKDLRENKCKNLSIELILTHLELTAYMCSRQYYAEVTVPSAP